jgi:crotonyl-CoA reductase
MGDAWGALLEVALAPDAAPAEIAAMPLPETMRAALVRKEEVGLFEGLPSAQAVGSEGSA